MPSAALLLFVCLFSSVCVKMQQSSHKSEQSSDNICTSNKGQPHPEAGRAQSSRVAKGNGWNLALEVEVPLEVHQGCILSLL